MIDASLSPKPYYVRANHFDSERMAGTVSVWKNNGSNAPSVSGSSLSSSLGIDDQTGNSVKAPSASFDEFLDIVNPLHHVPIVGNVYRSLTGDEISSVARIAGGAIYGGPIGGLSSLAQSAIEEHSGDSAMNSIRKAATADKVDYAVFEDARTAGQNKAIPENEKIETASLGVSAQKTSTKELSLDDINWNTRQPVTPVMIDLAMADAGITKPKQSWNLNG